MGWFQYYRLLEQYSGDLSKATKEEMDWAARGNPNDPQTARDLAEKKYREEHEKQAKQFQCLTDFPL